MRHAQWTRLTLKTQGTYIIYFLQRTSAKLLTLKQNQVFNFISKKDTYTNSVPCVCQQDSSHRFPQPKKQNELVNSK